MEKQPAWKQIDIYWIGSLIGSILFFFFFMPLAPLIMYIGIGKPILLLIGCGGACIGVNLLIKARKLNLPLSMLMRILAGILLNLGVVWFVTQLKPPEFTGVITEKYPSGFCLSLAEEDPQTREQWGDEMHVFVESSTRIYKNDSVWPWPKTLLDGNTLHVGQRVRVTYDGWVLLDGSIYAIEIVVLDDNSVLPNTGYSCGLESF